MTKQTGLGDNLYVSGYDLSGDIGSLSAIAGGNTPLEVTGIDKSAFERIGGKRDGRIEFTAWFNPSNNQAHDRLEDLPTTDQLVSYFRGTTLGTQAASMVGKQINYDGSRGDDGSLAFNVSALANGFGLEWGIQHTAGKRTDGAATNGTSIDNGAATTFGFRLFIHVFAFTGTSVNIVLQESSDDGAGDPFATAGAGFAALNGVTGITSTALGPFAGTLERYTRVATTGTFSNAVFAVMLDRFTTTTVF